MKQDKEEKRITLYIPNNVSTRAEIFQGFGKTELFQSLIGIAVVGFIAIIIYGATKNGNFVAWFLMFGVAGSVMSTVKDKYNQSMVGYIRDLIKYYVSQQKYRYKYYKEWGDF